MLGITTVCRSPSMIDIGNALAPIWSRLPRAGHAYCILSGGRIPLFLQSFLSLPAFWRMMGPVACTCINYSSTSTYSCLIHIADSDRRFPESAGRCALPSIKRCICSGSFVCHFAAWSRGPHFPFRWPFMERQGSGSATPSSNRFWCLRFGQVYQLPIDLNVDAVDGARCPWFGTGYMKQAPDSHIWPSYCSGRAFSGWQLASGSVRQRDDNSWPLQVNKDSATMVCWRGIGGAREELCRIKSSPTRRTLHHGALCHVAAIACMPPLYNLGVVLKAVRQGSYRHLSPTDPTCLTVEWCSSVPHLVHHTETFAAEMPFNGCRSRARNLEQLPFTVSVGRCCHLLRAFNTGRLGGVTCRETPDFQLSHCTVQRALHLCRKWPQAEPHTLPKPCIKSAVALRNAKASRYTAAASSAYLDWIVGDGQRHLDM